MHSQKRNKKKIQKDLSTLLVRSLYVANNELRVRNVIACVLGSTNMEDVVCHCLFLSCFGLVLFTFPLVFLSRGARSASTPVTIVAVSASASLRHLRVVSVLFGIGYRLVS